MKKLLEKFEVKDCVALVALVITGVLLAMGHDSVLLSVYCGIISAYITLNVVLRKKGG